MIRPLRMAVRTGVWLAALLLFCLAASAAAQEAPPFAEEGARAVLRRGGHAGAAAGRRKRVSVRRTVRRRPGGVRNDGKRYLRSLDENQDGRVTLAEFLAPSLRRFAAADVNHDGVISRREGRIARAKTQRRHRYGRRARSRRRRVASGRPYLARFDANGDGRVTLREYLAPRKRKFAAMDADRNGVISLGEAKTAKRRLLARRVRRRVEKRNRRRGLPRPYLASLDANGDGCIGLREYLAPQRRRFAAMDLNHDGALSPSERQIAKAKVLGRRDRADRRRSARGLPARPHRANLAPYLERLDADGDGRITLREYLAPRREKFAALDLNHDGVISRDEAQTAKNERRGRAAAKRQRAAGRSAAKAAERRDVAASGASGASVPQSSAGAAVAR